LCPHKVSDAPGVLVFPPALFVVTLVLGLFLQWLRPVSLLPSLAARLAGLVVLVLSWWLVHSAEAAMKRAGTNVRPDQPSLAIVTDGPFRFSRNPMYLATTGLYLGITLLVNTPWPLREERYLEAKFGEPYRAYKSRVRRWV
jgi:protein-S-isoprenylcysteine O-methyltransferase Ste14